MIQETAEALSKPAMYGGSAMGVGSWAACKWPFLQGLIAHLGGIEKSDVFGAMGVSIAFLGLVTNVLFNWRRDKRERAALKARMGDVH